MNYAITSDAPWNQGWKDSANGIVMEDGKLAEPPVALPEAQGDVYLAWSGMAELFERASEPAVAQSLRDKAKRIYERFNKRRTRSGLGS